MKQKMILTFGVLTILCITLFLIALRCGPFVFVGTHIGPGASLKGKPTPIAINVTTVTNRTDARPTEEPPEVPLALNFESAASIAEQIVAGLSTSQRVASAEIQRIAIYRLENDEGDLIGDQLHVALSDSRFQIMERDELESLMREHNLQEDLYDLMDSDSLIEMGNWLGVEAILFGEVRANQMVDEETLFRDAICWLSDLDTGERLWTASVSGQHDAHPWYTQTSNVLGLIVLALALIVLLTIWRAQGGAVAPLIDGEKQKRLDADRKLRNRMVRTLASALDDLTLARGQAHEEGDSDRVQAIRSVEGDLRTLSDMIGSASTGASIYFTSDEVSTRHLDHMLNLERTIEVSLRDVTNLCAEMRSAQTDEVETLRERITQLQRRFQERQDHLAGMDE